MAAPVDASHDRRRPRSTRRSSSSSSRTCSATVSRRRRATRLPVRRAPFPSLPSSTTSFASIAWSRAPRHRPVRLVVGFSMGAQQAFQWGALVPTGRRRRAVLRLGPDLAAQLLVPRRVKAAFAADAAFATAGTTRRPSRGCGPSLLYLGGPSRRTSSATTEYPPSWAWLSGGRPSVPVRGAFRGRDANDLLAMLWTWWHADISANDSTATSRPPSKPSRHVRS